VVDEAAWLKSAPEQHGLKIEAGGAWTLPALGRLDDECRRLIGGLPPGSGPVRIALDHLSGLDTAGAWLLHRLQRELGGRGHAVAFAGARQPHAALLAEVQRVGAQRVRERPPLNPFLRIIAELGEGTIDSYQEGRRLLSFYGQTVLTLGRVLAQPRRIRLVSLVHHLEQTCLNALPIVGLISFLIGIVLAYQGADQLRYFGAEIFTVNLLAISVLREIGILLTAIVVAGRSGSAFTAQIGTMKVNEEVDAMRTLGLDPFEVLVLPRLIALMIALPLLAFFADIMALFGGGLMCVLALDFSAAQFFAQLDYAITPVMFWVGIIKAPVFAFLIAMVGCYKGLSVSGSAESVGRLTTQSVVVSIFLVIVFDALFSVLFSYFGV
jgi:phospholipid/cholesterol/gamma-HCH transport system permease protein